MITTAAIVPNGSSAPTVSGRQGNAAVPQKESREAFLNAVSALSFSGSPDIRGLASEAQIPDTTRANAYDDRQVDYRDIARDRPNHDRPRTETAAPAGIADDPSYRPEQPAASATRDVPANDADASFRPTSGETTDRTLPANRAGAAATTQGTAERQPLQSQQPVLTSTSQKDLPTPAQAARPTTASNGQIGAQIIDGNTADQLPQTNQTLSGRAALVVQAQSTKVASDQPTQVPTRDGGASSLFASAAQTAANGAGKTKGAVRAATGGQANNTANAGATQTAQPNAALAAAATAPAAQPQAQTFGNSHFSNGQSGQQASTARADGFTQAGTAQNAPQFNLRPAASSAPARPAPPIPKQVVTNQVAVQIQKAAGQGNDRISIQLKPADLGRVEVRLDVGADGRVAAIISADRADTLDMLQRDARILQNSLQNAGLQADSDSLSFQLKGQNQAFDDGSSGSAGNEADAEAGADISTEDAATTANSQAGVVTEDRVDIQV